MRQLTEKVFQTGFEHEYGIGWCYVIVGNTGLILVDPGFGWHFRPGKGTEVSVKGPLIRSESLITPHLMDLLLFAQNLKKPIAWCILTHSHVDHTLNWELLQQKAEEINLYFNQIIVNPSLIVHQNNTFRRPLYKKIEQPAEFKLDGHDLEVFPSPGHSSQRDDISIFLKDSKILFCGDLCQPQGRDYHICEGPSPIPYFDNGDLTRKSLQHLMSYDFTLLLTSHGFQYNHADGLKALKLTSSLLDRIEHLALLLIKDHPTEHPDRLALWIYDTITHERKFDREKAEFRKVHFDRNGVSDFQKYDKVTIDYFISTYFKENKNSQSRDL